MEFLEPLFMVGSFIGKGIAFVSKAIFSGVKLAFKGIKKITGSIGKKLSERREYVRQVDEEQEMMDRERDRVMRERYYRELPSRAREHRRKSNVINMNSYRDNHSKNRKSNKPIENKERFGDVLNQIEREKKKLNHED